MVCELGLTGLPTLPNGSYFVPGVNHFGVLIFGVVFFQDVVDLIDQGIGALHVVGLCNPLYSIMKGRVGVVTEGAETALPVDVVDFAWCVLDLKEDVGHGSVV